MLNKPKWKWYSRSHTIASRYEKQKTELKKNKTDFETRTRTNQSKQRGMVTRTLTLTQKASQIQRKTDFRNSNQSERKRGSRSNTTFNLQRYKNESNKIYGRIPKLDLECINHNFRDTVAPTLFSTKKRKKWNHGPSTFTSTKKEKNRKTIKTGFETRTRTDQSKQGDIVAPTITSRQKTNPNQTL